MTVTLRSLHLFLSAAEALHFSAAAKRMNMAQPAFSRAIKALEDDLGVLLFERSTRRVELTEAGRLLQQGVGEALTRLDAALERTRKAAAGAAGTLSIAYMDFAIEGEFPAILRDFRKRYPAVKVVSTASYTDRILAELTSGKVDVGFVVGPVEHEELLSIPVQWDPFVAVVPEGHRLAERASVPLRALADEPFIMGRAERWGPYVRRVDDLCRQAGFTPNVVQEADTTPSIFAFVGSGMGATLYVDRGARFSGPGTRILALEDVDAGIVTEVAWRRDDKRAIVKNFLAACRPVPLPVGGGGLE